MLAPVIPRNFRRCERLPSAGPWVVVPSLACLNVISVRLFRLISESVLSVGLRADDASEA